MSTEKSGMGVPTKASSVAQWKRLLRFTPRTSISALGAHPVVPYALAVLLAVGAKLPTLNNSVVFIDEPSYLNEAARLDTPLKFALYARYITETKFPLGLVPYIAALWLDHSHAILWVHIFGLLAVIASTVLLVALSYRAFRNYVPGILAALLWSTFLTKDDMTIAPMLEYFQAPFVLAALWVFAGWVRVYSAGRLLELQNFFSLVVAGGLIGAAALVKPPGVLVAPVLALGVFFATGDGARLRVRLCAAAAPLAGTSAVIAVFVLPYLLAPGALHALLFNMVELSGRYSAYQASLAIRLVVLLFRFDLADILVVEVALVLHGVILRKAWRNWSREERLQNVVSLVILGAGLALLAGYLTGQGKGHYIVPILPLLALYAWGILTIIYTRIHQSLSRVAYTATLVLLILIATPSAYATHYLSLYSPSSASGSEYAASLPGVDAHTLAAAIVAHTRPGDSIWVYYNAPEIYWLANRKPATDEPVGTWLVDYYDQFWFQHTLLQLLQERPTVIVGFDNPRYPRARVAKVLDLPLIGTYIQSHYTCSRATAAEVGGPAGVEFCTLRPSTEP
ncbi:MAG: hypothetical protein ACXWQR_22980 [Ktedonobacterales bacterium]